MLESHNDVAVAIAKHIGGSVDKFADMMNSKARELGLKDTYFITPNGLDTQDEEGNHSTTAYELAEIMRYCIMESPKKEEFIEITQTKSYSFTDCEGNRKFNVNNKNALFNIMQGVISGKTGFTSEAGYCYVGAIENDARVYIVALLGCGWPNNKSYKWSDTEKLFNYGLRNYNIKEIINNSYITDSVEVIDGIEKDKIKTYIKENKSIIISDYDKVEYKEKLINKKIAPIKNDEILGELEIYINYNLFMVCNIYSAESVDKITYNYWLKTVVDEFLSIK